LSSEDLSIVVNVRLHAHACHNQRVRTTIEMKPEHRARLLELAAIRGEKGFSTVVDEAVELYLNTQHSRTNAVRNALALKGSMPKSEAHALYAVTQGIRLNWR